MNLSNRKYVVIGIVIFIVMAFVVLLFTLQISDDYWTRKAANLTERSTKIYPPRGLIYDRNGELLVANQAIYDLMMLPREVKDLDTLSFCMLLQISKDEFDARLVKMRKSKGWASNKEQVFIKQIRPEDFAPIAEQLYKYPGFFGQPRTVRNYKRGIGALLLGDIGEVVQRDIDRDPYYRSGDYIGKGGIEMSYEDYLRGQKGVRFMVIDPMGRPQESFNEGDFDTLAISGQNIISTIYSDLQAYGEYLMQHKKGSIVAIEPATGEILAMVSSPTYDPNLLVGRDRGENYGLLQNDSLLPLYNRAIKGTYRPGSIFKMVQALIALDEDRITPQTRIACNRSLIGCHGPHTYDDLEGAIIHSCNPYFRGVMQRMVETNAKKDRFEDAALGMVNWKERIESFGFGTDLDTDIPGVNRGNVPGKKYYDKIYGEGRWAFSTIYSISIGEGELLINPLQMANLGAVIANRGFYYPPHTVKDIGGNGKLERFRTPKQTNIDPDYFETVVNAMQKVVEQDGGTARRARTPGITVCGKTGTVQNDPLPDHSVFMAFAPKENPKIAISVYVESAGFGGTWAAPIASLMIEKYITDSISDPKKEQRVIDQHFFE
ncbi:MAG: penicillin-binding transpeptidase domain-containing protein [Flavobacteriales bacterium]|nr:penicillin-binding transpeptidase domain-containing protein [Flavobacteriales bacterium]